MLTELWQRAAYLLRRRKFDAELGDEVEFHIECRADELEAGGMTRRAAITQARREFGSAARMLEDTRSAWQFGWVEDLASDLRYAARAFRRNPGFALTAIACLALGIGANTTIFSVTAEALLSRPSVRDPESLRRVRVGGMSHRTMADYRLLRDAGAVAGLAGEHEDQQANWRDGDSTRRLFAVRVTGDYFDVTGTPLAMGRGIAPDERDTAVVSWRFWQERLGADTAALGRKLILDGRPHTVVGVLTKRHRTLIGSGISPDLYLPAGEQTMLSLYARLAPGTTAGEARAKLAAAAAPLVERNRRGDTVRISEVSGWGRLRGEPDFLPMAAFFAMLMAVVSLVLLIACANVASLLLARASSRSQELAIRLSIGAGRGRIARQLLAETLLLSLCGAAAGLALNMAAASWLARIELPLPIPIRIDIQPDLRLAAYAAAVAVACSLAAGIAPALQGARAGLARALNGAGRQTGSGWRLRNALVAGQVAVSIVLLSAAFLFLRNLREASGMNPGFDKERTVWTSMRVVPERYPTVERTAAFVENALDRLRSTPGVEAAAIARVVPLNDDIDVGAAVRADGGKNAIRLEWHQNEVSPDYFRVMQIPLLAGRDFRRADRDAVILNENFARALFGDGNPIGRTLEAEPLGKVEVIGVARNSNYFSLGDRGSMALYRPYTAQAGEHGSTLHFLARASGRAEAIVTPMRDALDRLDPAAAIEARPMRRALTMALLPSQAGALALGSVGLLGLALASIGLYGVVLYAVSRRAPEIGVRMALGATPGAILRLVLRHSLGLAGVGMACGITMAVFAVRPLAMFLIPSVRPGDPLNFLAVAGILGAVALAATAAPAIRAIRTDPLKALRHE